MSLFYTPNPVFLSLEETNHAKNVLRLKELDIIETLDGKGNYYKSKIITFSKIGSVLEIISQESKENDLNYKLHIAIAPTKNSDRLEWFVEKAVEIGISEITFLQCKHSERKQINIERIEKVVVSAMKQSKKYYAPKINNLFPFSDFVKKSNQTVSKFIAYLEDDDRFSLKEKIKANLTNDYLILIGPEGDFSSQEIETAKKNNYIPVSLGNSRLRTETAGIYATSVVSILNGEN